MYIYVHITIVYGIDSVHEIWAWMMQTHVISAIITVSGVRMYTGLLFMMISHCEAKRGKSNGYLPNYNCIYTCSIDLRKLYQVVRLMNLCTLNVKLCYVWKPNKSE
jgi:hypothetical protein